MSFDYKKYSLENLENWLHDVLSCEETSPHEIYSVIRKVVQDQYNYHKEQSQKCLGLLELLSGHRPLKLECDKDDPSPECQGAWNDFWEQSYLSGVTDTPEEAEELRVEIEKMRGEGKFKQTPSNYSEMIAAGYTMTDDGFWMPSQK